MALLFHPACLLRKLEEQRKPFLINDKAKAFFNQRFFWWNGQFYTRSDLIKFLANKLGGVHYELGRDKTDARIEEIQNHFGIQYRHEKQGGLHSAASRAAGPSRGSKCSSECVRWHPVERRRYRQNLLQGHQRRRGRA